MLRAPSLSSGLLQLQNNHLMRHGLAVANCFLCASCTAAGKKDGIAGATTWTALHPQVLQKLPGYIQLQLPIVITRRGAVDRAMLDRLTDSVMRGGSFTGAAEAIRDACERKQRRNQHLHLEYQLAQQLQSPGQITKLLQQSQLGGNSRAANSAKHLELSTDFQPSRQYLSTVWLEAMRPRIDWANRYLSTITGRFWCMDHTFATAKSVRDVDVAFNVETDAEVALFFRLYHDADLKNRDGSHNFINMAAQFNTAFVKQVLTYDGESDHGSAAH